MATLENLKKSVKEMSDEELDALLREVRSNRRAPRDPSKPKRIKGNGSLVSGMSKTSARQLLAMIQERTDGSEDGTEGSAED